MTFPDGRVKDGMFENNVFKGTTQTVAQDEFLNASINTQQQRYPNAGSTTSNREQP